MNLSERARGGSGIESKALGLSPILLNTGRHLRLAEDGLESARVHRAGCKHALECDRARLDMSSSASSKTRAHRAPWCFHENSRGHRPFRIESHRDEDDGLTPKGQNRRLIKYDSALVAAAAGSHARTTV